MGRARSLNNDEGRDAHSSEQGRAPAGQGLWCAGGRGGEGAEEAVARGRRERRKKNTNRYLHNQWQVGNLYAQQPVKVGESAFGYVLVKN